MNRSSRESFNVISRAWVFLLLHFWHSSHSLQEEPEICPKQVIEVIEAKADDVPSRPSMSTGTTAAVTRSSRPAAAAPAAPAPQMQPPEEAKDGDDGGLADHYCPNGSKTKQKRAGGR